MLEISCTGSYLIANWNGEDCKCNLCRGCSVDLSAVMFGFCFHYVVYISSYSEIICFYLLFQIRCILFLNQYMYFQALIFAVSKMC